MVYEPNVFSIGAEARAVPYELSWGSCQKCIPWRGERRKELPSLLPKIVLSSIHVGAHVQSRRRHSADNSSLSFTVA